MAFPDDDDSGTRSKPTSLKLPQMTANDLPPFQIPGMGPQVSMAGLSTSVLGPQAPPATPTITIPLAPNPNRGMTMRVPTSPAAPAVPTIAPRPPDRAPQAKPPGMEESDPLMSLGKPLVLVALLGSLFTRRPAVTAMNAMAGAMQAQRQGDIRRYEEQYKLYEQNLKTAMLSFREEQADFNNAMKERAYDDRMAKFRVAGLKHRNSSAITALDGGDAEGFVRARHGAGKAITAAQEKEAEIQDELKKNPNLTRADARALVEQKIAEAKAKGTLKGKASAALGDPSLEGEAYLNSIEPADARDYVKAIAEGREKVPQGKWAQPYRDAAFHLNPSLRGQEYGARAAGERYFASGQGAGATISLNQMMGHMANAQRSAQSLSMSGWRTANKGLLAYARETNDPRVGRFLTDLHVLRDEAARVFKGTATEGEIKRGAELLDEASSYEYFTAQLQEFLSLIKSRMDALSYQYQRSTGRPAGEANLLSPHAQESFDQVNRGGAPEGGKHIGFTPDGKPVYEMPDGSKVVAQ